MARSPRHYQHALENPPDETPAMRVGAYVHASLLAADRQFAFWPNVRRGKDWELFARDHDGATILNTREHDTALDVIYAVRQDKDAMALLGGHVERRIEWALSGRACAGTPDAVSLNGYDVTELKVTADANPRTFQYHATRQGWCAQLVWYADGLRAAGIADPQLHYIVAVEAKPPHVVTRYFLTDAAVDLARRTYRALFEQLMVCEESGVWPGYTQAIVPIDSPEELTLTMDGEEINV